MDNDKDIQEFPINQIFFSVSRASFNDSSRGNEGDFIKRFRR